MLKEVLKGTSKDMAVNMFSYNDNVLRLHISEVERGFSVFDHPFADSLFSSNEFDLIVAEHMAGVTVAAKAAKLKVKTPIVKVEPVVVVR